MTAPTPPASLSTPSPIQIWIGKGSELRHRRKPPRRTATSPACLLLLAGLPPPRRAVSVLLLTHRCPVPTNPGEDPGPPPSLAPRPSPRHRARLPRSSRAHRCSAPATTTPHALGPALTTAGPRPGHVPRRPAVPIALRSPRHRRPHLASMATCTRLLMRRPAPLPLRRGLPPPRAARLPVLRLRPPSPRRALTARPALSLRRRSLSSQFAPRIANSSSAALWPRHLSLRLARELRRCALPRPPGPRPSQQSSLLLPLHMPPPPLLNAVAASCCCRPASASAPPAARYLPQLWPTLSSAPAGAWGQPGFARSRRPSHPFGRPAPLLARSARLRWAYDQGGPRPRTFL
nr:wiskott-Aldrich syndrome protein homolog 1-like [Aegilops tauschii subsp. strangulata]